MTKFGLMGAVNPRPPFLDASSRRRWAALGALVAVDAAWAWKAGFGVPRADLRGVVEAVAVLAFLAWVLRRLSSVPRLRKTAERLRYPGASDALHCALQLMVAAYALEALSYLGGALNRPMITDELVAADAMLGFDWPTAFDWTRRYDAVRVIFAWAYKSGLSQLVVVPALLGLAGRRDRLDELVDLFAVTGLITIAIATAWPSETTARAYQYSELGLPSIVHLDLLRDGTLRELPLARFTGLVTFPSFHATMAMVLAWSCRGVARLGPAALALNGLMILATPTEGAHFLVDIIGGAAVFALVAWGRAFVVRTATAASKRRGETGERRR